LLDPAFVQALEHLRLEVRRRIARGGAGERRSVRRGASVEFAEHRAYTPGDDPRRIDWNAYARLSELVVRLFVAEQDVTVYLVLDASRSMALDAAKFAHARTLAAALGYLALTGAERVALTVVSAGGAGERPVLRGRASVPGFLAALERVAPSGTGALGQAVDALLARGARPGLAVLVSDLYDDGDAVRAARRLAVARFEPTVLHVLSPAELAPPALGEAELWDSETAERLALRIDAAALARYGEKLAAWLDGLARACRAAGARYVRAFADRDPLAIVADAVARGGR
jgi:uncharacterized protein (DUF58 family)